MAGLKLGHVNPVTVKIPSSFHAAGSRLIRPHNVFMPSTTILFPSVVLNRKETVVMKCCFTNTGSSSNFINKNTSFVEMNTKENPVELVAKSIAKALEGLRKPAAAALVVGLLLLLNPNLAALAASGGRMGGSAFSSGSSSSSSSYDNSGSSYSSSSYDYGGSSYSSPSYDYGGSSYSSPSYNYGGSSYSSKPSYSSSSYSYGGSSYSSPSYDYGESSYSSPSYDYGGSSYSSPSYDYGGSSYSSKPSSSYSYGGSSCSSEPSYSSSSYSGGGSSYSSQPSSSSSSSYSRQKRTAEKGSDFLIRPCALDQEIKDLNYIRDQIITESIGAPDVADALDKYKDYLKSYQNCKTENQKKAQQPSPSPLLGKFFGSAPASSDVYEVSGKKSGFPTITAIAAISALLVVAGIVSESFSNTGANNISVLKLQVGLLGLAKSLQKDLDRIAETADTSTPEGLHYVLSETTVGLLRHSSYWISTHSYVDVKSSMDGGEKRFNELSIEERAKFGEETLVNVNNIKRRCSKIVKGDGISNKYIVLTILVAVGGLHNLPTINNSEDLKDALQILASIPLSRTLAVEVLWTPQKENDTLSEQELREDYPMLRPL